MLDIEIRQFRDDLIDFVNQCKLPLEVKRLVFNEVQKAISEASDNFINQQKQSIIQQLNDPNNVHESNVVEETVQEQE